MDEFVDTVAGHRGRRIQVLACELPDSAPSGAWVQTPNADYIVHAANISGDYRRLVICHEVAHMLLNHAATQASSATALMAPSIAPDVAARFLTRRGYGDDLEAAAEALGTMLAAGLARRALGRWGSTGRATDTISTRLR